MHSYKVFDSNNAQENFEFEDNWIIDKQLVKKNHSPEKNLL